MIGQFVFEAYEVLAENRARTLMALFGLVIGVAAVTAIFIAGRGMAGAIDSSLGSLKDHSFIVVPNEHQPDNADVALRLADLGRLAQATPGVTAVIPFGAQNLMVELGHAHKVLSTSGEADERYLTTPVTFGRYLSRSDVRAAAHVCVLSNAAFVKLVPDRHNPVGESVRIGERRYLIIGVQAAPQSGFLPDTMRADVLIPYTTFVRQYLHGQPIYSAKFLLTDGTNALDAERAVRMQLRDLKGDRAEYEIIDRRSLAHSIEGITMAVTASVALIGGDLPLRGGDRDPQHHARVGGGADARDRFAQSDRRDELGRSVAIFYRGAVAVGARLRSRAYHRADGRLGRQHVRAGEDRRRSGARPLGRSVARRRRLRHDGRGGIRYLPRIQRGAFGPDRGLAV